MYVQQFSCKSSYYIYTNAHLYLILSKATSWLASVLATELKKGQTVLELNYSFLRIYYYGSSGNLMYSSCTSVNTEAFINKNQEVLCALDLRLFLCQLATILIFAPLTMNCEITTAAS